MRAAIYLVGGAKFDLSPATLGLRELAHPLYIENAKIAPMLERLYMGTHPATLGRFGKTDKKTLLWTSPFTILRVRAACLLLQLYRVE